MMGFIRWPRVLYWDVRYKLLKRQWARDCEVKNVRFKSTGRHWRDRMNHDA